MISAHEAREKVASISSKVAQEQLKKIEAAVVYAVENAKQEAYAGFLVIPSVKKELEELGFTVETVSDVRDGSFTKISWEKEEEI